MHASTDPLQDPAERITALEQQVADLAAAVDFLSRRAATPRIFKELLAARASMRAGAARPWSPRPRHLRLVAGGS